MLVNSWRQRIGFYLFDFFLLLVDFFNIHDLFFQTVFCYYVDEWIWWNLNEKKNDQLLFVVHLQPYYLMINRLFINDLIVSYSLLSIYRFIGLDQYLEQWLQPLFMNSYSIRLGVVYLHHHRSIVLIINNNNWHNINKHPIFIIVRLLVLVPSVVLVVNLHFFKIILILILNVVSFHSIHFLFIYSFSIAKQQQQTNSRSKNFHRKSLYLSSCHYDRQQLFRWCL